jgi:phosphoribosylformylglycinamidine synthase
VPIGVLTDDAPVYDRPRSAVARAAAPLEATSVPIPADLSGELLDLVGSPNVGSRAWVWRQYDHIVRGGTVVRPGSDAAVVRVLCEGQAGVVEKWLAFAVDCNARMCELDPYVGGAMAVAEVCRNLACSGAEAVGITDCLNFGNPERPEVMDQLAGAVDGIAAACNALGVPIVSGNVSLYNETDGRSILPTPAVAAVGVFAKGVDVVTAPFQRAGDAIVLLGEAVSRGARALGGSEWLVRALARAAKGAAATQAEGASMLRGEAPLIDLAGEARLQKLLIELARSDLLESAHDVSDGGLAAALAECCTMGTSDVGARVNLPASVTPIDALAALFGEGASRVVVSARAQDAERLIDRARAAGVPAARIGETGGDALIITAPPLGSVSAAVAEVRARRDACLRAIVGE